MSSAKRGNLILVNSAPQDYSRNAVAAGDRIFPVKVHQIVIKLTSSPATLQIQDGGNDDTGLAALTLVDLSVTNNLNNTHSYTFDTPLFFPNGIIISGITNCSAHLVFEQG